MRRIAATAGLFLLLATTTGAILHIGWTEFSSRQGLVTWAELLRRSDCPSRSGPRRCIVCPGPGREIRWPAEFHARRRAEAR